MEADPTALLMELLSGQPRRGTTGQLGRVYRGEESAPDLDPQGPSWGDLVSAYGPGALELALSVAPGSGEVMSAQDSVKMARDAIDAFRSGDYGRTASSAGGSLAAALGAVPLVGGVMRGVRGAVHAADRGGDAGRVVRSLPMDEASQMARAKDLGYDTATTFYRGAEPGLTEFKPGTFWSRDPADAAGHASRVGGDVYEARLSVSKPLNHRQDVKLGDVSAIADQIEARYGKDAADKFVREGVPIEGVSTADALRSKVRNHADVPIWRGRLLSHVLETNYGDYQDMLRAAGFDAIDTGRDVIKLTAEGIRHPSAVFDPEKSGSRNIFAGIAPLALVGAGAAYSLPENREK